MKLFKFISHPYLLIASFSAIMISGQHFGGFYLLYVLLALPHAAVHSLLALLGIVLLCVSYNRFSINKTNLMACLINLVANILLLLSLFFFFHNDVERYNYATFHQTIPQITLTIFFVISVVSFLDNLISVFRNREKKHNLFGF